MAVLRGRTTLASIAAWTAHAGQDLLAAAGAHAGADSRRQAPCGKTVTRLLGLIGAQPLADAVACYLAAAQVAELPAYPLAGLVLHPHLACDGKEVRGAVRPDGTSLFLLSAAASGIVIAEREIPAKTNEIPEIGPMLLELNTRFPLAGRVLTADALHTQRALATLICENTGAHYVFTVKGNQAGLYDALQALTWPGARRHATEDKGHGRRETRSHLVTDAPEEMRELFPHAAQVARVIRTRTVTRWKSNGKKTPARHGDAHRDRLPDHQPHRPRGRPGAHRRLHQGTLGHREQGALGPRRHAARGPLQGPGQLQAPRHGHDP